MVNSIVPGGVSGLGAPHHEPRLHRANVHQGERRSDAPAADDSVELSAASLAATRESVVAARGQLGQVLSLAQDARATLVGIQALLSGGGSQIQLEALLAGYGARADSAVAEGLSLARGQDALIVAEPGAAAIVVPGVDLRVKAAPGAHDVIQVPAQARLDDLDLPSALQRSLDVLQGALSQLSEVARALDAHSDFVAVAEKAVAASVRHDLDAEGARLLALQVRQGLEAVGTRSIANAAPEAVLALFRSL